MQIPGRVRELQRGEAVHEPLFDFIRVVAMFGVVLYHAAASHSLLAPYWAVHDSPSMLGDFLREFLDIFIMPFFMFVSGWFLLPSLRKRTLGAFAWNKFRRLGAYWIFAVLVVIPFFRWKGLKLTGNYFDYWLNTLFASTSLHAGPLRPEDFNHMHFWFVSLLFYFAVLFGIIYKIAERFVFPRSIGDGAIAAPEINYLRLLLFGLLTAGGYFISILLFPDSSWIVVPLVFQAKATALPNLAFYFLFGVYCSTKRAGLMKIASAGTGRWLGVTLILSAAFLVMGRGVFENIDLSNLLPAGYLLGLSLIRSFLLLSALLLALSVAGRYFNRATPLLSSLSATSYETYLVHAFFIIVLQEIFLQWPGIPPALKIAAVFAAGSWISYLFGRYILAKFTRTSAAVLFILFFVCMVAFNR